MSHFAILVDDGIATDSVTETNIGAAAIVLLPFRIRVRDLYTKSISVGAREVQLFVHNEIPLPDIAAEEAAITTSEYYTKFSSRLLVVVKNPKVDSDSLAQIRALRRDDSYAGAPRMFGNHYQDGIKAINAFLVAYALGAKQIFSGRPVRPLTTGDFFGNLQWELTLVLESARGISEENVRTLFDLRPDRGLRISSGPTGELFDLPLSSLEEIDVYLSEQGSLLHHELAVEARARMVNGDERGALLLAVAALESAHAVIVSNGMASVLPPELNASKVAEDFSRELGMTKSLSLTPYLFLPKALQPSRALLADVEKAIRFRNEIMHSLKSSGGEYRSRQRTLSDLSSGVVSVLELTSVFVRAAREMMSTRAARDI